MLAAGEGFEPSHTESESAVLPLHNPAMFWRTKTIIRILRDLSTLFLYFPGIILWNCGFAFFAGLWYHISNGGDAYEKGNKGAGPVQYAGGAECGAAVSGRDRTLRGIRLPHTGLRRAAGGGRAGGR